MATVVLPRNDLRLSVFSGIWAYTVANGHILARCRFAVQRPTPRHILQNMGLFGSKQPHICQMSFWYKTAYGQSNPAESCPICSKWPQSSHVGSAIKRPTPKRKQLRVGYFVANGHISARCRFGLKRPTAKRIPPYLALFGRNGQKAGTAVLP